MDFHTFFKERIDFLNKYSWIFKSDNVRYVKDGILEVFPEEWIKVFDQLDFENGFNEMPFNYYEETWPESLKIFFNQLRKLRPIWKIEFFSQDHKPINGVGVKKMHEILNLSALINRMVPSKDTLLIDLGSGLGYLSQMLCDEYGFRVLGIEGSPINCEIAMKNRNSIASKENVTHVNHFVTENSLEFIRNQCKLHYNFNSIETEACMVGLHACADLTINAIRLFFEMAECKRLIIMPCCYHRMILKDKFKEEFENLPASNVLRAIVEEVEGSKEIINVAFARLACQQSAVQWRTMTKDDHIKHGHTMFERALVELIPLEGEKIHRNSSTRKIDCTSFEHVKQKYTLLNQNDEPTNWLPIHEDRYNQFLNKYSNGEQLSQYIKCLQNCVQNLCEYVVMMDRLCYAQEIAKTLKIELKNIEYKKILNDELSPRGFVLIIEK